MYIRRNISWHIILRYAWLNLLFFAFWAAFIFSLYHFLGWTFIDIPFQPLSVIGIAVAFYIGFKNSQSYDRFWEGRKIWGGIVNYSRTWANQVLSFVDDTQETRKTLIYRHLAWINALRIQLRQPTSFSIRENKSVEALFDRHGERNPVCDDLNQFLNEEEIADLETRRNVATHLIKLQGLHVKELLSHGRLPSLTSKYFTTAWKNYTICKACANALRTRLFPGNTPISVRCSAGSSFSSSPLDSSIYSKVNWPAPGKTSADGWYF